MGSPCSTCQLHRRIYGHDPRELGAKVIRSKASRAIRFAISASASSDGPGQTRPRAESYETRPRNIHRPRRQRPTSVVENLRPGRMRQVWLRLRQPRGRNPRIILCRSTHSQCGPQQSARLRSACCSALGVMAGRAATRASGCTHLCGFAIRRRDALRVSDAVLALRAREITDAGNSARPHSCNPRWRFSRRVCLLSGPPEHGKWQRRETADAPPLTAYQCTMQNAFISLSNDLSASRY